MIYTKYILSLTNYLQFLIVWIFKFIKGKDSILSAAKAEKLIK